MQRHHRGDVRILGQGHGAGAALHGRQVDLFTPATPPVTLTPIATGFNNPIGIDYHEPTDQVILSVNWPSGQANNFEIRQLTSAQFRRQEGLSAASATFAR
jgi:hypothetical protein